MLKQEVTRYSALSKGLHWLIALMVILMLSVSFFLDDVPSQYTSLAYTLHKSLGLSVLGLMLIRIVCIIYYGRPSLPKSVPGWIQWLSRFVQYSFYVLLLVMPLSGWIMSMAGNRIPSYFGLFPLPLPGISPNPWLENWMDQSHKVIAWILIALICLHIAGAIKHYFIDKDGVVNKMFFK